MELKKAPCIVFKDVCLGPFLFSYHLEDVPMTRKPTHEELYERVEDLKKGALNVSALMRNRFRVNVTCDTVR